MQVGKRTADLNPMDFALMWDRHRPLVSLIISLVLVTVIWAMSILLTVKTPENPKQALDALLELQIVGFQGEFQHVARLDTDRCPFKVNSATAYDVGRDGHWFHALVCEDSIGNFLVLTRPTPSIKH